MLQQPHRVMKRNNSKGSFLELMLGSLEFKLMPLLSNIFPSLPSFKLDLEDVGVS